MNRRKTLSVFAMLIIGILSVALVHAQGNFGASLGVEVVKLEVNNVDVTDDEVIRTHFERGEDLDILVTLQTSDNTVARDVEIEAEIFGDDHFDISDSTETFDVEPGVVYNERLTLRLPDIVDKDDYKLRILVSDRYSSLSVFNYNLQIATAKHKLVIKDVSFSPSREVLAGRALLSVVRIENFGEEEEEGIKVELTVPELAISAVDYIDELEEDDEISSEELFVRVPRCAETGRYKATVEVTYDDGFERTKEDYFINVIGDANACALETGAAAPQQPTQPSQPTQPTQPVAEEKTIISLGTQSNVLTKGEGGAIYPVSITNQGASAKTYTLTVSGVESFGTVRVSPSNVVVVDPYQQEEFFVFVAANEVAAVGQKSFTATVSSGSETLQTMSLTADVVDAAPRQVEDEDEGSAAKGLWVAVIVLVVLLIIVAILVGYKKMKEGGDEGDDEPEDELLSGGQSYY